MRDVNTGRLKAGFGDYPILAYNVQQGNFPDLRLVIPHGGGAADPRHLRGRP